MFVYVTSCQANAAVEVAQSLGNAEVAKEESDSKLALAQLDNEVKETDLVNAENELKAKKDDLDKAVAALTASF